MNTLQKLKDRIILDYGCAETDFSGDMDLSNDLELDSLDRTDLFMWCEKEFKVPINSYESEQIETLIQLKEYINNRTNGNIVEAPVNWRDAIRRRFKSKEETKNRNYDNNKRTTRGIDY